MHFFVRFKLRWFHQYVKLEKLRFIYLSCLFSTWFRVTVGLWDGYVVGSFDGSLVRIPDGWLSFQNKLIQDLLSSNTTQLCKMFINSLRISRMFFRFILLWKLYAIIKHSIILSSFLWIFNRFHPSIFKVDFSFVPDW